MSGSRKPGKYFGTDVTNERRVAGQADRKERKGDVLCPALLSFTLGFSFSLQFLPLNIYPIKTGVL